MTDANALYSELKDQIEAVATPLIDFSERCLRARGNFGPHAAVLTAEGNVELFMAQQDGQDSANAAAMLPVLHEGLRLFAKEKALAALGVAESVTITFPGEPSTLAIKVLFEHRRGLTVSLYVPYETNAAQELVFSPMFSVLATPEVKAFEAANS